MSGINVLMAWSRSYKRKNSLHLPFKNHENRRYCLTKKAEPWILETRFIFHFRLYKEKDMKKVILLLISVLIFSGLAAQYIPVEIVNRAEDANGRALVSKFREIIRTSSAYEISRKSSVPRFVVQIDTMDRYKGDSSMEGLSTIYHYMILVNGGTELSVYCTNQLGYVGMNYLDQVAYEIYSALDEFVEMVISYLDE